MARTPIPAFLSIDVEPDGFQLRQSSPDDWSGFSALIEFIETLRQNLQSRRNETPRFGWYYRTDPQIAEVYGHATYPLMEFAAQIAQLSAHGDYSGVHMHPVRWSESHQQWVHDLADKAWLRDAIRFSLEAFLQGTGTPASRVRIGAGFLNNDVVATLDEMNVAVDLTLEPVAGWGLHAKTVPSGVDESPIVGAFRNCQEAPREAYRPSRHDFQERGRWRKRPLAIVPLTTYSLPEELTFGQRLRRALTGKPSRPAQVLYPGLEWPSPTAFWDLAAQEVHKMRRPHLSLAIRTDAADSKILKDVCTLFEALPDHPLSRELCFMDPLEAIPSLVA